MRAKQGDRIMNRRAFLTTAAASVAACASGRGPRQDFALTAELDAAIARAMALNAAPSIAVAVYTREGRYMRGFGVTDIERGERVNAETAFYIASSTKPLTALSLAKLHFRRAFDLDTTLANYAPDAPFPSSVGADQTRFRDLLAHTSGIENGPLGYRVAFTGQHDPQTLWRLLNHCEVNDEAPRGRFDYTNEGYNIATVLSDRGLGIAWQDLLKREIFSPAGMVRASARMSRAVSGGWSIAKPHSIAANGGPLRTYLEKTDQTMQSAGGVIMSAEDAVRWLELMLENGRVGSRQVLAPDVVAAVQQPLTGVNTEFEGYMRESYGLGWYLGPYGADRLVHHFGGFAGFRAHVSFMPARGVGVAAFVNSDQGGGLTDAIANLVYDRTGGVSDAGQRFDAALEAVAIRKDRLATAIATDRANRASRPWALTRPHLAYTGAYESEAWGRIEVAADGEALSIQYGALRSRAEPFTQPNSVRVELVPGRGEPIQFEGDQERPSGLRTRFGQFARV
jgi:CubicO group peptidase (beta-lactamase class C family)